MRKNSSVLEKPISPDKNKPLSDQECTDFLAQPGILRALRTYSSDAFRLVFRQAIRGVESVVQGDEAGKPHAMLIAQALRENNCDPVILQIDPPGKISSRLSHYERIAAKAQYSTWNSLTKLLSDKVTLQSDDWMTVFKTLAKAVEGDERNSGFELVKIALMRPDMTLKAIAEFPKIFRSARGDESEILRPENSNGFNGISSLMSLASGRGFFQRQDFIEENSSEIDAVKNFRKANADLISAIKTTKIKESQDHIIQAALRSATYTQRAIKYSKILNNINDISDYVVGSERKVEYAQAFLDSYCDVYGRNTVLNAKDENGRGALHHACLLDKTGKMSAHLMRFGFDECALDIRGKSPLQIALTETNENGVNSSFNILKEFSSMGKITSEEILKFSDLIGANDRCIPDPSSRAFILAERARIEIDRVMKSQKIAMAPTP